MRKVLLSDFVQQCLCSLPVTLRFQCCRSIPHAATMRNHLGLHPLLKQSSHPDQNSYNL